MNAKDLTHQLLDESIAQDARKHDHTVNVNGVCWNDEGKMIVPEAEAQLFGADVVTPPMSLTDWSMMQVANKLGKTVFGGGSNKRLPVDYLMAMKPYLRATVLNDHVKDAPNETWLVRGYEETCRAVLSERYGLFSNTEMLQMLADVMDKQPPTGNVKIVRSTVTPDSLNFKIVWADTGKSDGSGGTYGVGFYVGNGETGNYKARIFPLVQRTSCTNSIIPRKGADGTPLGYEFKHIGSLAAHRVNIEAQIIHIFPQAAELVEKMILAEGERLPDFLDVLNGLAKDFGWTDSERLTVAAGTEGRETRAALVNGVTYAAHQLYNDHPDTMVEWEMLGGDLLVAPDSVFSRARRLASVDK